ncbi:MAG: M1 family metallopeptidase [Fimbriimonas sp.]
MTAAAIVALLLASPSLAQIDTLAKARDVAGLQKLVTLPKGEIDPFPVLKTNGAYEVGKFGWRAYALKAPDGTEYVVIGTALTSQDVGEIVLRREGNRLVYVPETDALGIHLGRHRFDLAFDVPNKRVSLVDRLTFRSKGKGSFLFRMSPAYRVSGIEDAKGRPIPFRQASGVVATQRPAAGEATYTIRYGGVVDLPQYAGSISDKEATLVNDYWYPMVARQPTPYEIAIKAPKDWISVAQGNPLPSKGDKVRYRMDLPVVYFSVISAPFRHVEVSEGGRVYRVWSTRLEAPAMLRHAKLTRPIVEYYADAFGTWPFNGFGAIDSRQYGGGALEAYSFATYGGWVPSEDAHEPAHTLWGGVINNTYLKSFWNESFAVFSDGLYHREVPIGNPVERRLAFIQDAHAAPDYNAAPLVKSGAGIGPAGGSLGYGKGGVVLQMLEQWLGTESIVGAMREWLRVHPKGVPGNWEDFERVVRRRETGRDVKGFFDDWARRPGYANFEAAASYANGATLIDLKWKGPRFRMPLTVLLRDASGGDRYRTVWLDGKSDRIRLAGPRPVLVSVDPWRQAVREIAPAETPVLLTRLLASFPKVVDPKHPDWLTNTGGRAQTATGTVDPAGKFLVGSPETWPLLRSLCSKAGFEVSGNGLTYKGTTIDLTQGAAIAVVDLEGGKQCIIGLGKTEHPIDFGRTCLIVADNLGRFLRGVSEPKTRGPLTYRL